MCGRKAQRSQPILAGAALLLGTGCSGPVGNWTNLYAGGAAWSGWHTVGGGHWSVENGEIVGRTGDGRYGWLVNDREYADFVLEVECKHEGAGNSGIQFRSHVLDGTMYGWQADFHPTGEDRAGAIYDEGGTRQWIAKASPAAARAFKRGDWNLYRITAIGDHVVVEVNGATAVDIHDSQFTRGVIALQVHSGLDPPVHVRFRNVRIRELDDREGLTPLFDGKSLKGWRVAGAETWAVENGEIVAQCRQNAEYCYLIHDGPFDDFYARLQFLYESQTGNSGFFFRCAIDGVDIKGPQAEISPRRGQHTGLLYEAGGRGWLNMECWDTRKDAAYRPGEWNTLEVRAVGPRILTHLNGYPISDVTDEKLPRRGILALQMHSGEAMRIRFREILYRPLRNGGGNRLAATVCAYRVRPTGP